VPSSCVASIVALDLRVVCAAGVATVLLCVYVCVCICMYVCMYLRALCMYVFMYIVGHAVVQLVEALRYKPEGLGFDSRWCHCNFSLT